MPSLTPIPAPIPPPLTITRRRHTTGHLLVVAHGSTDELTALLLLRAGFTHDTVTGWYALPHGLGEAREKVMAGQAAAMLHAAHYPVLLDPDLEPPAPRAPRRGITLQDIHTVLRDIAEDVRECEYPIDLGLLLSAIVDERENLLTPLADLLQTAGHWMTDLDTP